MGIIVLSIHLIVKCYKILIPILLTTKSVFRANISGGIIQYGNITPDQYAFMHSKILYIRDQFKIINNIYPLAYSEEKILKYNNVNFTRGPSFTEIKDAFMDWWYELTLDLPVECDFGNIPDILDLCHGIGQAIPA